MSASKSVKSILAGRTHGNLNEDRSELIPTGQYRAEVMRVEEKVSKAGNPYLSVSHKLTGNSSHNNQWVFNGFNILHPDESVRAQAEGALKTLLSSAGMVLDADQDLEEPVYALVGTEVNLIVTQRAGRNGYGPTNEVSRYVRPVAVPF